VNWRENNIEQQGIDGKARVEIVSVECRCIGELAGLPEQLHVSYIQQVAAGGNLPLELAQADLKSRSLPAAVWMRDDRIHFGAGFGRFGCAEAASPRRHSGQAHLQRWNV
jgi:hypothetical protein